jgi:Golgi nucleoside diphosphatase
MMHPLEDTKSWELALQRKQDEEGEGNEENEEHRRLKKKHKKVKHHRMKHKHHDATSDAEIDPNAKTTTGDLNQTSPPIRIHQSSYDKNVVPPPEAETMQALMIDAGSQGTRIHLYEFERRILHTAEELTEALNGFKISIPTTNTRWTNRLKPGLDEFALIPSDDLLQSELIRYLGPLFDFAKTVLGEKEDDWKRYPIYLKATGGLRTLRTPDRIRLVGAVRELFQNKTFNPFNFDDPERARVISGEEEAMYGWAAVNFAKGKLVDDTEGKGEVLNPHRTWGMMEMGGASTQISWFENEGDVMANLMKLQIGNGRHWNLYAHSFLYFGVNGAWSRLNARLFKRGINSTTTNPCLPSNASVDFSSWMHFDEQERPLPRSDPLSTPYSVVMSNDKPNFEECTRLTRSLLRKDANKDWVQFSHDGDCSYAGVYQPPLPQENSKDDEFIVTSNYNDVWMFLQLPSRAKVIQVQEGARLICKMDKDTLQKYNARLQSPVKDESLYQFCFRATLTFEMLHTGYGFSLDYEIESADVVNGQKLGWALGSTLYEINTLPWEFGGEFEVKKKKRHKAKDFKTKKTHILGIERPHDESVDFEAPFAVIVGAVGLVLGGLAWAARRHVMNSRTRQNYQSIPAGADITR